MGEATIDSSGPRSHEAVDFEIDWQVSQAPLSPVKNIHTPDETRNYLSTGQIVNHSAEDGVKSQPLTCLLSDTSRYPPIIAEPPFSLGHQLRHPFDFGLEREAPRVPLQLAPRLAHEHFMLVA